MVIIFYNNTCIVIVHVRGASFRISQANLSRDPENSLTSNPSSAVLGSIFCLRPFVTQHIVMEARGMFDFEASEDAELTFKKNDLLKVSDISLTHMGANDYSYYSMLIIIAMVS